MSDNKIDMEAVAGVILDLRNGEHVFWDAGWSQSNADLLAAALGSGRIVL